MGAVGAMLLAFSQRRLSWNALRQASQPTTRLTAYMNEKLELRIDAPSNPYGPAD
jgi:TRAP-type mannitol/chloroaromatic compound transport system permease large subunit